MAQVSEPGGQAQRRAVRAIQRVVMLQRPKPWPRAALESAEVGLREEYGHVPTLAELAAEHGAALVTRVAEQMAAAITALQQEAAREPERMAPRGPCHLCAGRRDDDEPSYVFARVLRYENRVEWGGTLAGLALTALFSPIGVGVTVRPRRVVSGHVAPCRLLLCVACARTRRGLFGGLKVSEADCAKHPASPRLKAGGYDSFLSHAQLEKTW